MIELTNLYSLALLSTILTCYLAFAASDITEKYCKNISVFFKYFGITFVPLIAYWMMRFYEASNARGDSMPSGFMEILPIIASSLYFLPSLYLISNAKENSSESMLQVSKMFEENVARLPFVVTLPFIFYTGSNIDMQIWRYFMLLPTFLMMLAVFFQYKERYIEKRWFVWLAFVSLCYFMIDISTTFKFLEDKNILMILYSACKLSLIFLFIFSSLRGKPGLTYFEIFKEMKLKMFV